MAGLGLISSLAIRPARAMVTHSSQTPYAALFPTKRFVYAGFEVLTAVIMI
jgi:hypothetical protein